MVLGTTCLIGLLKVSVVPGPSLFTNLWATQQIKQEEGEQLPLFCLVRLGLRGRRVLPPHLNSSLW